MCRCLPYQSFMRTVFTLLIFLSCLHCCPPAAAQQLTNDGFHRRNGQMHVLRNGQLRPMTRDSRLPTGTVVTKDGFLVAADGARIELLEGQGCDLNGRVVAIKPVAGGKLALGSPISRRRGAEVGQGQSAFEKFMRGSSKEDERRDDDEDEDDKKRAEKAREQQKRQEEWLREEGKRYEEHGRGNGKKGKGKWKKNKKWDD